MRSVPLQDDSVFYYSRYLRIFENLLSLHPEKNFIKPICYRIEYYSSDQRLYILIYSEHLFM